MVKISHLGSIVCFGSQFIKFSNLNIKDHETYIEIPEFMPKSLDDLSMFYSFWLEKSIKYPKVSEELLEWGIYLQSDIIIQAYCEQTYKDPKYTGENEHIKERLLIMQINKSKSNSISIDHTTNMFKIINNPNYKIKNIRVFMDCQTSNESELDIRPDSDKCLSIFSNRASFLWQKPGTLKLIKEGLFSGKSEMICGYSNRYPEVCNFTVDAMDVDVRPFMKSFTDVLGVGKKLIGNKYILNSNLEYPYNVYSYAPGGDTIENIMDFNDQIDTLEITDLKQILFKRIEFTNIRSIRFINEGVVHTLVSSRPLVEIRTKYGHLIVDWYDGVGFLDSEGLDHGDEWCEKFIFHWP